jgi:hypothetical protein
LMPSLIKQSWKVSSHHGTRTKRTPQRPFNDVKQFFIVAGMGQQI